MLSYKSSQKGSANTILVVLLVIAAFLIGSLWTRIQYLDKGGNTAKGGTGSVTEAPVSPAAQPTPDLSKIPTISSKDYVRGNKNANLVLIEYSDFECPFCKRFHPTMQQVLKEYGDKVAWVYRDYPLPFHQNAQMEAEAAKCVGSIGGNEAYWTYADTLYEKTSANGTSFTKEQLVTMAGDQGLDSAKVQKCLDDGTMKQVVIDEMNAGQTGGISGTPGTIILNKKTNKRTIIPGALPFEEVKKLIDEMI